MPDTEEEKMLKIAGVTASDVEKHVPFDPNAAVVDIFPMVPGGVKTGTLSAAPTSVGPAPAPAKVKIVNPVAKEKSYPIPNIRQYLHPDLRFCKILYQTKKPFESDWVNKPYVFKDIECHISTERNFGILAGYGGLIIIDCDEQELHDAVRANLPETFEVKTGSGGTHCYYFCPAVTKKIILQNSVKHYGEVQAKGAQVVGATSLHPNGTSYDVMQDKDIQTITLEQLMDCVNGFMKLPGEDAAIMENKEYFEDSDGINSVPITQVINTTGFKKAHNGELFGPNPWHGSTTGMNTWVSPSKNIANCFRCNAGISVAQAIALNEGILKTCVDKLRGENFKKVLKIAQDKYGLKLKQTYGFLSKELMDKVNTGDTHEIFATGVPADRFQHSLLTFAHGIIKKHPIFFDSAGIWWIWDDHLKYWKVGDDTDVLAKVEKAVPYDVVSSKPRTELLNAMKLVGRNFIPMDIPDNWIQFKNGIVDLSDPDLKLIKPSPKYFTSNPLPYDLGEQEDTPVLDKLFEDWVGKDYVRTLYEIVGYCMIPKYPLNRIFCLHGGGSNGKSTFLEVLTKCVGLINVTSTELDLLMSNRFEVTKLHKKLACLMGETNLSEINNTSIIKKLCGRDIVSFEYKFAKKSIDERNYAKIILSTNNLPPTPDKTKGFYRRWVIIDFPNEFDEKRDIMSEIPEKEYNNLCRKAIRLLKEVIDKREFTNEGSIEDRRKRYEDRSDPLQKFINEFTLEDAQGIIYKSGFERELNKWCHTNRFRTMSQEAIGKKMREKGIESIKASYKNDKGETGRAQAWIGIKWKYSSGDTTTTELPIQQKGEKNATLI